MRVDGATTTLGRATMARLPDFTGRFFWFLEHRAQYRQVVGETHVRDGAEGRLEGESAHSGHLAMRAPRVTCCWRIGSGYTSEAIRRGSVPPVRRLGPLAQSGRAADF